MKLKEYITALKDIEKTHPDVEVVCSKMELTLKKKAAK
jgi:hypothetical protein